MYTKEQQEYSQIIDLRVTEIRRSNAFSPAMHGTPSEQKLLFALHLRIHSLKGK